MVKRSDSYYLDGIKNTNFLKEKTKSLYLKHIDKIQNDIWINCKSKDKKCDDTDNSIHNIIYNPTCCREKVQEYGNKTCGVIANKLSDHTLNSLIAPMVSIFIYNQEFKEAEPELYEKWKEEFKIIKDPIDKKYLSNTPTERQKKAYVSYEDVVKIRDKLKDGSFEKLLLYMYTAIPPVRSDYYNTKIYYKKPDTDDVSMVNYIVMTKKPYIVLNKYKTAKKYKTIIIEIPDDLKKEIEMSLEKYPREYLFVSKRTLLPFDKENTFNKWANRTLKAYIKNEMFSLTTLRHIYISRRDLKLEEKTGLQQELVASKMGHSIGMQKNYMWLKEIDD
jgi:integrase